MKFKKLLLISILLIFLIGAVSADENTTPTDNVSPEIQVPSKIWKDGDYAISIETTEPTEVNVGGAVKYNSTVNGKASVPIKNLETGRHSIYINSSNTQKEYNITVLKENPDWNMDFEFLEDEILYGPPWDHELIDSSLTILNQPEGLIGDFTFYVNSKKINTWNAQDTGDDQYSYGDYYTPGLYNFTLEYSGDDYFHAQTKTKITEFALVTIEIPKEVVIGYDDEIWVRPAYDSMLYSMQKVNVTIKINDEVVLNKTNTKISNYYTYSLSKLTPNQQYDIEVNFSSDIAQKTKKVKVNVTNLINNYVNFIGQYDSYQDSFKYVYGKDSEYVIWSPKLNLDIKIDGKKAKSTYDDGSYLVDIDDLAPGLHNITVSYNGDKKYAKNTFTSTFEVVVRGQYHSEVSQNKPNPLSITLPEDATGNVAVDFKKLEDKEFQPYATVEVKDSVAEIELPTDHVGYYQFKAYYSGNYEINEISGKYFVKDDATWILDKDYYPYSLNEDETLILKLFEDCKGNLTVNIEKDGKNYLNYTVEVKNGTCMISIPTNHIGSYLLKTSFTGNCEVLPYKKEYEVSPDYYIDILEEDISYNSKEYVSLELPKNGTGNLTLEVKFSENDNYTVFKTVELNSGKASIRFPTGRVGKVYYNVLYSGNYEVYNQTDCEIIVTPTYTFKNNVFTLIADSSLNGTFEIFDWFNEYEATSKIINGKSSIDVTKHLKQIYDETTFSLYFTTEKIDEHDMGYEECVKPIYDLKIVSKDVTMYYGDGKYFQAKIYRNGKPVGKGHSAVVKIGSIKYYPKTDKNGIIKVKLTQVPNKYKITTTFKVKTVKNTLKVKPVLKLKTSKVKRSAKKLVLTATLKKGKKAIKYKKVTFKFNGKTIKAKTNANGIAKATVTKAMLKKLKVGKKITYQATYVKETVKKTAKIRR